MLELELYPDLIDISFPELSSLREEGKHPGSQAILKFGFLQSTAIGFPLRENQPDTDIMKAHSAYYLTRLCVSYKLLSCMQHMLSGTVFYSTEHYNNFLKHRYLCRMISLQNFKNIEF